MKIQQLKQEIEKVQAELHGENQRGALKDSHKVANLETKLSELSQQLDTEERASQYEAKIEESHSEIAYFMDTLKIDDYTMRDLCKNEEAYNLLRAVTQQAMMNDAEKRLNEQKEMDQKYANLRAEKELLQQRHEAEKEQMQQRYDELYEESTDLRKEIHQLKVDLEDSRSKHKAAVTELEESRKEVARLNGHVDDLRKQLAVGAVGAVKSIDVDESLKEFKRKLQEEKENKTPIYNVQPLDAKGAQYSAQLAENDEVITFGWLEKGQYREVTAEEAEQFRRSAEKSNGETVATPGQSVEESLVPVNLQFQEDETDDAAEHGLDESDTDREVEAEATGSVEERLKALEQRVSALEGLTKEEAA